MPIPEFQTGQKLGPAMRDQLNALVREVNLFSGLRGDGLIQVTETAAGKTIGLGVQGLNQILPRAGAGTGIAIQNHANVIGRIPSRLHSFSRVWYINEVVNPAAWSDMAIDISGNYGAASIEMPCFGKITELVAEINYFGTHAGGAMDLRVYNVTQTDDTDTPQIDNLTDGLGDQNVAAGLAVNVGDKVRIDCRATNVGSNEIVAAVTFTVEEQTAYEITGTLSPDATGVYVRNGQYGGKPAFERVDGAYWIWWNSAASGWYITCAKGVSLPGAWAVINNDIVNNYPGGGTHTGTATVAARAD